jgi:hypothetical protein
MWRRCLLWPCSALVVQRWCWWPLTLRDVEEVSLVAVFSFSGMLRLCWWPLTLSDVEVVPLVAVFSFSGAEVVLVAAYL